jgi:hypothetical protein
MNRAGPVKFLQTEKDLRLSANVLALRHLEKPDEWKEEQMIELMWEEIKKQYLRPKYLWGQRLTGDDLEQLLRVAIVTALRTYDGRPSPHPKHRGLPIMFTTHLSCQLRNATRSIPRGGLSGGDLMNVPRDMLQEVGPLYLKSLDHLREIFALSEEEREFRDCVDQMSGHEDDLWYFYDPNKSFGVGDHNL